ncbi:MAG: mevalonate kinase [Chloroflexota bacterium]|nr:mevalonate kinase [Chloroflexota bacterium]
MAIVFGKAPGKIILFGEHAVVYGKPAIAIPVTRVKATARVLPNLEAKSGQVRIQATDIQLDKTLTNLTEDHPLRTAVRLTFEATIPEHIPAFTLQISSNIPISAGMGSSAAVSIAIIRALSAFLGKPLPNSEISDLAYEVEKIHHGTPSGIDNNVVAYGKPVYYVRGKPVEFIQVKHPTHWLIADTGEKTSTRETVSAVRTLHEADPSYCDPIFDKIGHVTQEARQALKLGDIKTLGKLMNENQLLLIALNVSSLKLDHLIKAARTAGASGAKLSGGGRGGNIIALAPPDKLKSIEEALHDAGAQSIISTKLTVSEET